jgi:carbonic anhydrase
MTANLGSGVTPDEALALLAEGNHRFMQTCRLSHDRAGHLRALRAVVVACSDSFVSPDILFGSGAGELFVVQVAGNTIDGAALGAVEYGVAMLSIPLVVVLGHGHCEAVSAAVSALGEGLDPFAPFAAAVERITPAVLDARDVPGDLLENAARENVRRQVRLLRSSGPVLPDAIGHGRLRIVGAYHHPEAGRVEFFMP